MQILRTWLWAEFGRWVGLLFFALSLLYLGGCQDREGQRAGDAVVIPAGNDSSTDQ